MKTLLQNAAATALLTFAAALSAPAFAVPGPLDIAQDPLYLTGPVPPMNMIVMGRDHKLYYEAYNDATDLTGDGQPDIGYKPQRIDYYGYFDSFKCYDYSGGQFVPAAVTANKKCSGRWSGDFLNYLTTSRMDALRKVLYGGRRSTDSATATVLERSYIPQDAHSWGKEYQSIARDGFDIREYAPLGLPAAGRYHLFANTSLRGAPGNPLLRVLTGTQRRVWEWLSIEQPVAGDQCVQGTTRVNCTADGSVRTDYNVRVSVCVAGLLEPNCRVYPNGTGKPIGLLQRYGEDNQMLFGLLTGSYINNTQGGVLRRNMGRFSSEVIPNTGQFSNFQGIVRTIDAMRIVDFRNDAFSYQGGWVSNQPMTPANFPDWANPIGEMMYESLRYFGGKAAPTPAYVANITGGVETVTVRNPATTLSLPAPAWNDPYDRDGGQPWCSRPANLVISDTSPSFDSDSVPGSAFATFSGDLAGFNATSEANAIWAAEHGGSSMHFIGTSGAVSDSTPSPKLVSGLGNVRGLSPEEPTRQGSYYAASAARFGQRSDLRPDLRGIQNPQTYAVALASPLPKIEFPVGNGRITLVPFSKSTSGTFGGTINAGQGQFQPTNQIVDFYIERWANTDASNMDLTLNGGRPYAKFRVNYEDVEQGADHDMDMIVSYTLQVDTLGRLQVQLVSEYAAGGIEQAAGYAISGSNADGVYIEVRDCDTATPAAPADLTMGTGVTTCSGNGPAYDAAANTGTGRRGTVYFLSTPNWGTARPNGATGPVQAAVTPGQCALATGRPAQCAWGLPLSSTRTFTATATPAATVLQNPLWYAAKFGADANTELAPGANPGNYFLVTNAATLETQLSALFNQILQLSQFAGGIASNGTRIDAGSMAYIPEFDTRDWTGDLSAYRISPSGVIASEPEWRASQRIVEQGPATRRIFTQRVQSTAPLTLQKISFSLGAGGFANAAQAQSDLGITAADVARYGSVQNIISYLRGNRFEGGNPLEIRDGGVMRNRSRVVGDILGSQPAVMGREDYGWSILPGSPGELYRDFLAAKQTRTPVVFVGANDGMLHAFDGRMRALGGGAEMFAYVPYAVHANLKRLPDPDYFHRYFVDGSPRIGDALLDGQWRTVLLGTTGAGGRSVFALDVTNPESFGANNILWEFTGLNDPDLGATIGQAQPVRLTSGRWVAIFGNGYNSSNHRAALFVLDLRTGEVLRKFVVGGGSATDPNGLAQPVVLGATAGSIGSDLAYAGDLHGNVWRFDLSGEPSEWSVGVGGQPLFAARDANGNRQSITGGLDVIAHPERGRLVFFGTGQYFLRGDNVVPSNPQIQSFYSIWDDNQVVSGRADLVEQRITSENPASGFRSTTNNPVSWATKKGWFMDLRVQGQPALGERFISRPQVRLGKVFFPTFRPTGDQCSPGGENVLMVLNATSGRAGIVVPPGGTAPDCGANCGGVNLPPGPPSAPPPVIISPPGNGQCRPGIDPGCNQCDPATDPTCTCAPNDPTCLPPSIVGGSANVCGNFIVPIPGQQPLVFARPCGRQSWRQLR